MPRQSISFTDPNSDWLQEQIVSKEFSSKSEIVNDLIRKAREVDSIKMQLIKAEQSGFINQSKSEVLTEFKNEARRNEAKINGKL